GTGAGTKTRILLEELHDPAVYVPIDISKEQLEKSSARVREMFPALQVLPVWVDYLEPFELPLPRRLSSRSVIYFPGSTIGNFEPPPAKNNSPNIPVATPLPHLSRSRARLAFMPSKCGPIARAGLAFSISAWQTSRAERVRSTDRCFKHIRSCSRRTCDRSFG